jgi:glucoamylase
VRLGFDGWQRTADIDTRDTTLGLHVADVPSANLRAGGRVEFTFFWTDSARWQGRNYEVAVR